MRCSSFTATASSSRGAELHESIGLANGTAGNAVLFAGITNVIALLALNVTGIPMLAMMGSVAAFCVVVAVMLATTIIPALLRLAGRRILSPRERRYIGADWTSQGSAESRISEPISVGRSLLYGAVSIAALVVLALFTTDIRLAFPDAYWRRRTPRRTRPTSPSRTRSAKA